jgi:hypothetical protein
MKTKNIKVSQKTNHTYPLQNLNRITAELTA